MSSGALQAFRDRGLAPKKSFGQNFLVDKSVSQRIAELATPSPGGTVVEIGAGLGALTEPLLARAAKVIAIERDCDLCPILLRPSAHLSRKANSSSWKPTRSRPTLERCCAEGSLHGCSQATSLSADGPSARARDWPRERNRSRGFHGASRGRRPTRGAAFLRSLRRPHRIRERRVSIARAMKVLRGAFNPRPGVDSAVVVLTRIDLCALLKPTRFEPRYGVRLLSGARPCAMRGRGSDRLIKSQREHGPRASTSIGAARR